MENQFLLNVGIKMEMNVNVVNIGGQDVNNSLSKQNYNKD